MDGLGLPGEDRLQVALTFLVTKAMNWHRLAVSRPHRRTNRTPFKVKAVERYAPHGAAESLRRLRQVKQGGTVRDYIDRFRESLANCGNITQTESLQIFTEGLHPVVLYIRVNLFRCLTLLGWLCLCTRTWRLQTGPHRASILIPRSNQSGFSRGAGQLMGSETLCAL